jgi:predicted transcriptional regulator of viral defense system
VPALHHTRKQGGPDWLRLSELAHAQVGYFTTKDAEGCKVSSPLLRQNVQSGAVLWIRRGVYRFPSFPPHPQEDLVVFWLWAARESVFSHESALSLHELSDVLPNVVVMTVPPSWATRRRKVPVGVELHVASLETADVMWVGAVPVTHPLRTVVDCERAGVSPELVEVAVAQCLARGWFSRAQYRAARVTAFGANPRSRR